MDKLKLVCPDREEIVYWMSSALRLLDFSGILSYLRRFSGGFGPTTTTPSYVRIYTIEPAGIVFIYISRLCVTNSRVDSTYWFD